MSNIHCERVYFHPARREKLVIKLPKWKREAKLRSDSEDEHQGLMTTPQSKEELNYRLAKLYAASVPQQRKEGLSYELTRTLVAVDKQISVLKELKDVLEAADMVVLTHCELEEALAKAESRGWACADAEMSVLGEVPLQGEEASLPQGVVVSSESPATEEMMSKGMMRPTSNQSAGSGVVQQDSKRDVLPLSVTSTLVPGEL